jgi:hypothetical protein
MLFSSCEFDQLVTLKCNNLMYSSNISSALGFMIVGNCYDNIKNPKNLVFSLLACLSVLSLIEGVFMDLENEFDQRTVFTLYQISNVMEAGISIACIVTVHNWYEQKFIGVVSAILLCSLNVQHIT